MLQLFLPFLNLNICHKHFLNPWGQKLNSLSTGSIWVSGVELDRLVSNTRRPPFVASLSSLLETLQCIGWPAIVFVVDNPVPLLPSQLHGALHAKAAEVMWGNAERKITLDLLVLNGKGNGHLFLLPLS
ncbi:hypothetical protein RRG08_028880 [Elysia crispata]|uniref:Uncharacterized protein n=1 Tax=Elysia crispata TaxID=231223 RepID=A0AAE0YZ19_9GAST|nr:hypothetical protein RRG08_028880 [Elysia crispata]